MTITNVGSDLNAVLIWISNMGTVVAADSANLAKDLGVILGNVGTLCVNVGNGMLSLAKTLLGL